MVECVLVKPSDAGRAIRELRKRGLLEEGFKTLKTNYGVLVPVRSGTEAAKVLSEVGIEASECRAEFPSRHRRPRSLKEAGIEGVSGYHIVGDIAVFSRRLGGPPLEEYERAARVLVEEHSRLRSVWLKEVTEGEFRVQRLIHLAGEKRTWTIHKEFGLEFEVDIARVYFNPRLGGEHRRIAEETGNEELVLDMFSGVGGFSIHISHLKRARVVASDINPAAVYYAARNVARNRRRLKGEVAVVWADASTLPSVMREGVFDRIVMNHPTASKWFAWAACRLARKGAIIHYYTLTLSCLEAVDEAISAFSRCCEPEPLECREVLDYAPGVGIYRVNLKVSRR
ncbi:MAG: class I SAM-dependent methyltransferase family protein [Desulfurococcales archaeon]|nr:class I SAM-dependent methyltransferase family protein [Desulfurococcales archaeon]